MFAFFDADGSGELDKLEFLGLLNQVHCPLAIRWRHPKGALRQHCD